ncbi:hypothetical protein Tco_0408266 [Tanacetum coccineum]
MLKVLPWKRVVRFGKRGKLNPKYVGPFKVLEKVGAISYKLELPQELTVSLDGLHIDDKLYFIEEPVEIMDHEFKWLRQSCVPIVKVRWNSKRGPEFTCESDFIADGGDDDDDDDESSDDDEDDDDDVEEDEDEEEEEGRRRGEHQLWLTLGESHPFHSLPLTTYHTSHTRASVAMMRVVAPSTYILAPRSGILHQRHHRQGHHHSYLYLYKLYYTFAFSLMNVEHVFLRLHFASKEDMTLGEDMVEHIQGTPAITDVAELSQRMTDFVTAVRHDTDEIYRRLDDALDDREAILSCEAWGRSMDASNIACSKVRALRTTVLAQQTEILDLRAAARAQQHSLWETLRMMVQQTQVTAIVGTAREPARGLAQMRLLKERPVVDLRVVML